MVVNFIDDYVRRLEAGGQSEQTRITRRYHLVRFDRWMGGRIDEAGASDIEAFLAASGRAREYKRSLRSTLVGYFEYVQARGGRVDNPTQCLPRIKTAPPKPRPASDFDYYRAKRDAAPDELLMLRFAAEAGLRRGEVACIHGRDFMRDLAGVSLLVHGKGGKERIVPLGEDLARSALCLLREQGGGFLFPGNKGGHLSAAWVGKRISRLLPEGVTMHALRHRFATRVYRASHDILATQQLLGHSSPSTTQLYVAVDSERLREVARRAA